MILILTDKTDIHPNPVIKWLVKWNKDFFRLNTKDLLVDYKIALEFKPEHDFYIRNIRNGLEVTSDAVHAVWERRPEPPVLESSPQPDSLTDICEKEAKCFIFWLRYSLNDVYWIGHPIYDRWASSKILQLKEASLLGMRIPKTYFGNKKRDMLNAFQGIAQIAVKPLSEDWAEFQGKEYAFFTNSVTWEYLNSLEESVFSNTISFIQEYIPKAFELRVTVIGEDIFACRIDSQTMHEDTGKIDWRQGYDHPMKHSTFEADDTLRTFCYKYLKLFHLNFGCFDFIVSPEGEYVFLECNPNGQWLWIEELTNMPISKSVAEHLVNARNYP